MPSSPPLMMAVGSSAFVVLAGGGSRRFGTDKLSHQIDGRRLLDHTLAPLPTDATIIVVGPTRPTTRPVTFVREQPAGGGPAAALVAGLVAALRFGAEVIVVLPGDAPGAAGAVRGQLPLIGPGGPEAIVGVDADGQDQLLQLMVSAGAAARIVETAGELAGAGQSVRALIGTALPNAARVSLQPRETFDIDDRNQLAVWQLAWSTGPVEELVAEVDEAVRVRDDRSRPVVVALDGPSGAGKSTLAAALRLRLSAAVIDEDDFYGSVLPTLSVQDRAALDDDQVVATVFDWQRMRNEALLPLMEGRAASYRVFDWAAYDGSFGPERVIRPAPVIIVEGVYSARSELTDLVDLAVYVDTDPELRRRRRDSRGDNPVWRALWERGEAHYFTQLRSSSSFDRVVRLSLTSPRA